MVFRKIDDGSKLAAVRLYDRGRDSVTEITDTTRISRATFYRSLSKYRATGVVSDPSSVLRGRPRKLSREDMNYALELTSLR
jgi:transposase